MERISGVYIIKCLVNNKMYVGSSKNIWRRWQTHWDKYEQAKTKNRAMYDDMNLYGKSQFIIGIIYEGTDYKEMEKKVTLRLQPEYNIRNKTKHEKKTPKWKQLGYKSYHQYYYATHKEQCKSYNKKYLQKTGFYGVKPGKVII